MRRRRDIPTLTATTALVAVALAGALAVWAAEPPPSDIDSSGSDRTLLRHLHFEYGLVVACGLADDEVETGYLIRTSKLEQRLGIDDDADARYREINLGWTEADADWAAKGGPGFRDWCLNEASLAGNRFRNAFRDTGLTLNPRPDARPERRP